MSSQTDQKTDTDERYEPIEDVGDPVEPGEQPPLEVDEDPEPAPAPKPPKKPVLRGSMEQVFVVKEDKPKGRTPQPKKPEEPQLSAVRRRRRDSQDEWSEHFASLADEVQWQIRRVGPTRDKKGRKVQLGVYADETLTGSFNVRRIRDLLGGGFYEVMISNPDNPAAAEWIALPEIMGDPLPISGLVSDDDVPPPFPFYGDVPREPQDEFVTTWDSIAGCEVRKRKSDLEEERRRNYVPPAVQAALDAAKKAQETTDKTVQGIAASIQELVKVLAAPKPPEGPSSIDKFIELQREQARAEAQAAKEALILARQKAEDDRKESEANRKAEAERYRQERKEADEKRERDHKEAEDRRRADKKESDEKRDRDAKESRDRHEAMEKQLAEERKATREANDKAQNAMLEALKEKKDSIGALAETAEAYQSMKQLFEKDEEDDVPGALKAVNPDGSVNWQTSVIEGFKMVRELGSEIIRSRMGMAPAAPAQVAGAPAPQQVTQQSGAAPQQAPVELTEEQKAAQAAAQEAMMKDVIDQIVQSLKTDVPPSVFLSSMEATVPSLRTDLASYASVDALISDFKKAALFMPSIKNGVAELLPLVQVGGAKRAWAESLLALAKK